MRRADRQRGCVRGTRLRPACTASRAVSASKVVPEWRQIASRGPERHAPRMSRSWWLVTSSVEKGEQTRVSPSSRRPDSRQPKLPQAVSLWSDLEQNGHSLHSITTLRYCQNHGRQRHDQNVTLPGKYRGTTFEDAVVGDTFQTPWQGECCEHSFGHSLGGSA